MTEWIEHPGGPQPVADDVSLYVWHPWGYFQSAAGGVNWSGKQRFRILNQHLIDAARLEGIRLGLEAAKTCKTSAFRRRWCKAFPKAQQTRRFNPLLTATAPDRPHPPRGSRRWRRS